MAIKTAAELAKKSQEVAKNYKTLYVMGCIGAPLNAKNKERYCSNHSYNRQTVRTVKIKSATADTFGFDCVCFIKSLLWGWNGDTSETYGGAVYKSNDVPDIDADAMIRVCSDVSTDFSKIDVGEVVWMTGHIGVYIGNGLAVECTPKWEDCVQITAVHNIGTKAGYNGRKWTKHGKLPYVSYEKTESSGEKEAKVKLDVDGLWGSATTTRLQQIFGTLVDGIVSDQWASYKATNPGLVNGWEWEKKPNGNGSALIKAMQEWAGMASSEMDGRIGPATIKAFQKKLGTTVDGVVSKPSAMVKALQNWANKQP